MTSPQSEIELLAEPRPSPLLHGGRVHPEPRGGGRERQQSNDGSTADSSLGKKGNNEGRTSAGRTSGRTSKQPSSFSNVSGHGSAHSRFNKPRGGSNWSSLALGSSLRARRSDDMDDSENPHVIYPGSTWYHMFWFLTVMAAMITGITDPLEIAFDSAPGLWPYTDVWAILAYVSLLIFTADIVFKFFLAYQDPQTNHLVTDNRRIALHYMKLKFWVDLISTIPFEPILDVALGFPDPHGLDVRYIALVKFLYLIRMYRVLELFEELSFYMVFSQLAIVIVRNFTYFLYTLHWAACIYWIMAQIAIYNHTFPPPSPPFMPPDNFPSFTPAELTGNVTSRHLLQTVALAADLTSNATISRHLLQTVPLAVEQAWSWVGRHYDRIEGEPLIVRYIYSMQLALVTMTSLSDSDFYVANLAESIFTVIFLILCFVMAAYMLGSVSMLVNKEEKRHKVFRDRFEMIEQYSQQQARMKNDMPEKLLQSLEDHMELAYLTEGMRDEAVLAAYPSSMRLRVLRHLYLEPLRPSYLFKGCKNKFLDTFFAACRIELYLPGDQLFAEGDLVNELFIVVSGRVETSRTVVRRQDHRHLGGRRDTSVRPANIPSSSSHQSLQAMLEPMDSATDLEHPDLDGSVRDGLPLGASLLRERPSPGRRDVRLAVNLDPSIRAGRARYSEPVFLNVSDPVEEASFFGSIEASEDCWSVTATRCLALSRIGYLGLLQTAPREMRLVLENARRRTEEDMMRALNAVSANHGLGNDCSIVSSSRDASVHAGHANSTTASNPPPTSRGKTRRSSVFSDAQLAEALSGDTLTPLQLAGLQHLNIKYQAVCKSLDKVDQTRLNNFLNAAASDDVAVVRRSVRQGMSPNAGDYDGRTALMLAAGKGSLRVVQLLLELGADTSMYDNFGNTAMFEACKYGQDRVIEIMLAGHAKLHMNHAIVASQMCTSVFEGDLTMLMRLLRAGADPNACDYDKRCALHIAAAEGNLVAMRSMIEEGGADADFQDRWGNSPKDEALRCGAHLVLQYLDAINDLREPLDSHLSWQQHCTHDFLEACFSGKALHMRYAVARTPLPAHRTGVMVAAAHKHQLAVPELLSICGSSVLHEEVGHAMLLAAAVNGRDEISKVLRMHGARIVRGRHTDPFVGEVLGRAALYDHAYTIRRLLRVGVPPNLLNRDGLRALHVATAEGNLQAVRALIEHEDTDLDATDHYGRTALQLALASDEDDERIVDLLTEAAAERPSPLSSPTARRDPLSSPSPAAAANAKPTPGRRWSFMADAEPLGAGQQQRPATPVKKAVGATAVLATPPTSAWTTDAEGDEDGASDDDESAGQAVGHSLLSRPVLPPRSVVKVSKAAASPVPSGWTSNSVKPEMLLEAAAGHGQALAPQTNPLRQLALLSPGAPAPSEPPPNVFAQGPSLRQSPSLSRTLAPINVDLLNGGGSGSSRPVLQSPHQTSASPHHPSPSVARPPPSRGPSLAAVASGTLGGAGGTAGGAASGTSGGSATTSDAAEGRRLRQVPSMKATELPSHGDPSVRKPPSPSPARRPSLNAPTDSLAATPAGGTAGGTAGATATAGGTAGGGEKPSASNGAGGHVLRPVLSMKEALALVAKMGYTVEGAGLPDEAAQDSATPTERAAATDHHAVSRNVLVAPSGTASTAGGTPLNASSTVASAAPGSASVTLGAVATEPMRSATSPSRLAEALRSATASSRKHAEQGGTPDSAAAAGTPSAVATSQPTVQPAASSRAAHGAAGSPSAGSSAGVPSTSAVRTEGAGGTAEAVSDSVKAAGQHPLLPAQPAPSKPQPPVKKLSQLPE